jgi:HlyD family secretion protein
MPANRRLVTCAALVCMGVLSAALQGCGHEKSGGADQTGAAETPVVAVTIPRRVTLTRLIMQPGWLRAYEQTPIYARVPGYVETVPVDIGDHVTKDQLLAKLWVPELEKDLQAKSARADQAAAFVHVAQQSWDAAKANVETARAQVSVALAGIKRAEAEYQRWVAERDRAKQMYAGKVYDQQNLDVVLYQLQAQDAARDQAQATHLSAKAAFSEAQAKEKKAEVDVQATLASLKVAEADRDQAKVWLDYREVKAPYAGIVTQRNIHTGHFLQASSSGTTNKSAEPIFNMVRIDMVRVNVQVPEYDAPLVKDGAPATVAFQALKDREFPGTVTRFTDVLDDQARTLRVEIHLPNPGEILLPGMYVNATIQVDQPNTLTLPVDAVFTDGEKTFCFVVENGKAFLTSIKTGTRNQQAVEVLKKHSRSSEGSNMSAWVEFTGTEEVVASNPESLIDGQAVVVKGKGGQ